MRVRYGPRATRHLDHIHAWIAEHADLATADRILIELFDRCDSLSTSRRGTPRDDIMPGLRTLAHRGRYTIGYIIDRGEVVIAGIASAGQDSDVLDGTD